MLLLAHTTSIAALLDNRNAIAIEADQSKWLSAQNHVKQHLGSHAHLFKCHLIMLKEEVF